MGTRSLVVLVYLFVTAVCVAVSTWATFHGFRSLFGGLALPIALAVGASLFACDLVVQRRRREGLPMWGALAMLMIATCPSAISNYNFFYTNALHERVGEERFQEAYATFDRNLGAALAALRSEDARRRHATLRADVREELAALRAEMLDPRNLGLGEKAREHVAAIEQLMPRAVQTPAPPVSRDEAELLSWLARYESLALGQLDRLSVDDPAGAAIAAIETRRADAATRFAALQSAPIDGKHRQIAAWEAETAAMETLASQALAGQASLALKPVRVADAELGEIVYSLRSGFLDRPSPGTTAFALAAAILIDLFPLILALLLLGPNVAGRPARPADEPVSYRRVGLIN